MGFRTWAFGGEERPKNGRMTRQAYRDYLLRQKFLAWKHAGRVLKAEKAEAGSQPALYYRLWLRGPGGGHAVVVGADEARRLLAAGRVVTVAKEIRYGPLDARGVQDPLESDARRRVG